MIQIKQVATPFVTSLNSGIGFFVFIERIILFVRKNWIWILAGISFLLFSGYAINHYHQEAQRKKEELRKQQTPKIPPNNNRFIQ